MKLSLFTISVVAGLATSAIALAEASADAFSSITGKTSTDSLQNVATFPGDQQLSDRLSNSLFRTWENQAPEQLPWLGSTMQECGPSKQRQHAVIRASHSETKLQEPGQVCPDQIVTMSFASGQQSGFHRQQSCPVPAPSSGLAWQKGSWQITPYGFLSGEAIASDASITARPFVLYVNEDVGVREPQFTPHGQTTALGFDFKGPAVGAFQSGGNILFNFLGGQPVLNQSTPFLLRAYGELKNEDCRFGFGVAPDIFGAQTPRTVNFGGNLQAGNIAAFRGQLRAERYIQLADDVRWTTFGAISQQVVNDFNANPLTIGTDNGWPNIEGRLLFEFGRAVAAEAPIQLGVSGVAGQTRAIGLAGTNVSSTWGISADGQIVSGRFGTRYEVFAGEAIGTYNGAIGQSLNPENGEPISTVGGFAEVWCKLHDSLSWHVGYGIDNPNDSDLGRIVDPMLGPVSGQRSRNSVGWTSLFWNVTDSFELGFEVSTRETDYIAPSVSNKAMVYHFRTRLIF